MVLFICSPAPCSPFHLVSTLRGQMACDRFAYKSDRLGRSKQAEKAGEGGGQERSPLHSMLAQHKHTHSLVHKSFVS